MWECVCVYSNGGELQCLLEAQPWEQKGVPFLQCLRGGIVFAKQDYQSCKMKKKLKIFMTP